MDFSMVSPNHYSKEEEKQLLGFARKCIHAKLRAEPAPQFDGVVKRFQSTRGVFVTLIHNKKLRGCIGEVNPTTEIVVTISEVAISAAFKDPRFPALTLAEMAEIKIEISLLSPVKKIVSIDEIKTQRHGILIRHKGLQGLLLPQVAQRNGWDRQTLLQHVCMKADLDKDAWKRPDVEIMVFYARVFRE